MDASPCTYGAKPILFMLICICQVVSGLHKKDSHSTLRLTYTRLSSSPASFICLDFVYPNTQAHQKSVHRSFPSSHFGKCFCVLSGSKLFDSFPTSFSLRDSAFRIVLLQDSCSSSSSRRTTHAHILHGRYLELTCRCVYACVCSWILTDYNNHPITGHSE